MEPSAELQMRVAGHAGHGGHVPVHDVHGVEVRQGGDDLC